MCDNDGGIFSMGKRSLFFLALRDPFHTGLAIGMLIVPITTSAFQGLPDLEVPEATVIIRAFQQVGGSFGTAAVASAASGSSNASDFSLPIILLMIIAVAGAGCSLLFSQKRLISRTAYCVELYGNEFKP